MSYEEISYSINEVAPKVFHVEFSNRVDTALHFLRYQEFYESDSPLFFRKPFFFTEYLRWYSLTRGNMSFSYMADWSGFNVPGHVFEKFFQNYFQNELALDINTYDLSMKSIITAIHEKYEINNNDWNFYLIGTTKADASNKTLNHEIAHGLFATNKEYKKEMLSHIASLPEAMLKEMLKNLSALGYNQDVHFDEIQAYLATKGAKTILTENQLTNPDTKKLIKSFEKTFRKYAK